ncbi:endonuclease/exonuclease/phosphatase family protein [Flavobacterium sp. XN-5]|uniref:endonuclease/exonuclease/phosphatase family protein n=1 Tax=Flavobacterium sp. XN-5 TaxID=2599390 RepID=UPI0011C82606|nr:endonuclease/exonuclease/phosphatase family protein [Flavobacterium sp. XN-5]NGY37128.1 endonuclease/exonuclease/phosphatase family protein [Flavobacterium sp. XN-5]
MTILKISLYFFSFLVILTVLLPLIKKDFWVFRVFDYPRLQKFVIIGFLIAAWLLLLRDSLIIIDWCIIVFLGVTFIHLFYVILPFTFLGRTMIDRVKAPNQDTINILVSNVYQYNTSYSKLLALIEKRNPDIIFLVETDQKWLQAVIGLREEYPYYIETPQENTYGLLFYSKLPLKKQEINFLIDKEIPSIIVDVEYDNQNVRIYGLHPTPPVPQENKYSTDRDAEILLIGKMAKEYKDPCIVIGDMNDVAWSYTTELFLKTSELMDPRRGRGMYSTFNAKQLLLRWPLDHYFLSSHFRLVDMKVEKTIDSDHFPISISLIILREDEADKMEADSENKALADEKIKAGLNGSPR